MIDSIGIIQALQEAQRQLPEGSASKAMRLALVDPAYDPFATWPGPADLPRVTFEGEDDLGEQTYAVLNGYVPMAGDRVLMIPTGTTYTIVGKVGNPVDVQGFWADADSSGVELGGGSYYSSEEGMVLAGNLEVAGELAHGPRDNRVPEILMGTLAMNGPGLGTSIVGTVTFSPALPVGTVVYAPAPGIFGAAGGTGTAYARVTSASNTGLTIQILKSDTARANFASGENFTVHWVAFARPVI
jgi:hypothetical protein